MALTRLIGSRLRESRLALGLRQSDVARAAGVSASLLNLIEHNRRRVSEPALARLAGVLGLSVDHLAGGDDAALMMDLRAAAVGTAAELDRLDEFLMRFPGWAQALGRAEGRAAQAERAVGVLNDRVAHDPYLSQSLHDILQALSAVRSTAGILAETPDIGPDWRQRFHANLSMDAERMARGAEALVAYLDGSDGNPVESTGSPDEEVDAWLEAQGWHLAALERADTPGMQAQIDALGSADARDLAGRWVSQVQSDVAALPLGAVLAALDRFGADPLRIAQDCRVAPLVAFRRIATLPGSELGLVICDGSGTLLFRKPARGFALPRFGAACALWPLFQALRHPMLAVERPVVLAGRRGADRYLLRAYSQTRPPQSWNAPELSEAAMLIEPVGANPADPAPLSVGMSCRICVEAACAARSAPSILSGV